MWLYLAAMLAFATLDALRKAMSASVPVSIIVASRYLAFLVIVLAGLRWLGRTALLHTRHPWLQLTRSTVMVAEAAVFVLALRYASLADASAVFALAPIAGVILAVLLLGERAQPLTWIALGVSFAGVVIMLQPTAHSAHVGLWFALLAALLYALYGVLTRKVGEHDSTSTSFAYMTLIGFVLTVAFVAVQGPQWHRLTAHDGVLLGLAALAAAAGQYLLIHAYNKARAADLQPYSYFLFAWSVPISIVFFDEPPAPSAAFGTALVIASGVYLFVLARKRTDQRVPQ